MKPFEPCIVIKCDRCDTSLIVPMALPSVAEGEAVKQGWDVSASRHYCPECSKKAMEGATQ